MKYSFRLEKLLNLHRLNLKMLQRELAEAYQDLSRNERILKELYSQKSESFSYTKSTNMGSLADEFRSLQDIRITRQKEAVKQAHSQVENIRNRLIEKDRELKMIEKIKDRRVAEFFLEQEKLQQLEVDDISSSRFARSNADK